MVETKKNHPAFLRIAVLTCHCFGNILSNPRSVTSLYSTDAGRGMNGHTKLQIFTTDTRVCVLPTTRAEAYAQITLHYIFAFQDDVQLSNQDL